MRIERPACSISPARPISPEDPARLPRCARSWMVSLAAPAALAAGCVLLSGCAQLGAAWDWTVDSVSGSGPQATAQLAPTQGNTVAGTVRLVQKGSSVLVEAEITGLKPNSDHGFHVHEKGDCSAPDGTSAGPHFNPSGKSHGMHDQSERHAGDMPNLKADANGVAHYRWKSDALAIGSGSGDVLGRAIVVHRDADDYRSQPAGNSGPRLACGVIKPA